MSNGATDSSAVTNLWVTHVARSVCQEWRMLQHDGGLLNIHMACHCANGNVIASVTDVRQVGDASNVDEHCWLCETKFHQWQQAVATSEELGVFAVFAHE